MFDTVQAYSDSGLDNTKHLDNVHNTRHAMFILERRAHFKLERLVDTATENALGGIRSCREAWFLGTHGNLGGACAEDGLALWLLQWVLSEAQKFGLRIKFNSTPGSLTRNLTHLVFPRLSHSSSPEIPDVHDHMIHIRYSNGISAPFYDLTETLRTPCFKPEINVGLDLSEQRDNARCLRK